MQTAWTKSQTLTSHMTEILRQGPRKECFNIAYHLATSTRMKFLSLGFKNVVNMDSGVVIFSWIDKIFQVKMELK